MSTAKILNFPIRAKISFAKNDPSKVLENHRFLDPHLLGAVSKNPVAEAFWLAPGEAESNLKTLFWFRNEDPLHHVPKIIDIEEVALDSRSWLRRLMVIASAGDKMEVLGHASFEEQWNIESSSSTLILRDSTISLSWCEDLKKMLLAEPSLTIQSPAVHMVRAIKSPGAPDFNPTLLGLV